jgi:hypothetical protein
VAAEFNITAANQFFLGEDKNIDIAIFASDGVTPLDVSTFQLEWNMRKTDKAADPAILVRAAGSGLSIVGTFSSTPASNTQRVRLTFIPEDTASLKANFAYRHSLKRKDVGNASIFFSGSITFLQATEH